MRPSLAVALLAATIPLAMPASAHGDLTIHELETLAIRDFEGHEDSFAWEGWEIWDVYVGDGYDAARDQHGVYVKANFAGDGTVRPLQGSTWGIRIAFTVGDQAIQRDIVHDGSAVSTTFEALEWTIADGNVFQIKAWTPVPDWHGRTVQDLVIVSSVDGEARDTAPGGIHVPVSGTEVPVEGPGTGVFPPLGEGRIVEEVELTGAAKFLDVSVTPLGQGVFAFMVTNPLKEQGQHVHLREPRLGGAWTLDSPLPAIDLQGGATATFEVAVRANATAGVVEPLLLDLYTDVGGRRPYYAYLDGGEVRLTDDPALATAFTVEPAQEAPGLGAPVGLLLVGMAVVARLQRKGR